MATYYTENKTRQLKKAMVAALQSTLGIVSPALLKAKISRTTHYSWLKADEEYKAQCQETAEAALDFAECSLHHQIDEHQTAATIFYLKTKGKARGYIEKQEYDLSSSDGSLSPQPTVIELVAKDDNNDNEDEGTD